MASSWILHIYHACNCQLHILNEHMHSILRSPSHGLVRERARKIQYCAHSVIAIQLDQLRVDESIENPNLAIFLIYFIRIQKLSKSNIIILINCSSVSFSINTKNMCRQFGFKSFKDAVRSVITRI